MERTSIAIHLNPKAFPADVRERHGGRFTIPGYAAEIDGLPMVIHRPIRRDHETGEPTLDGRGWVCSEPTSGAVIYRDVLGGTRENVLTAAARLVERRGGRAKVEEAVRAYVERFELVAVP